MYRIRTYRWSKGVWYIVWTEGRRSRRLSTGTRDKAEAKIALRRFEVQQDRPPESWTSDILFDAYLADRKDQVRAYETLVFSLKPIRRHFGELHPDLYNPVLVKTYVTGRRQNGRSDGTIDKELRTLRQALAWGIRHRWLDRAPYVETPGGGPPRQRFLSKTEARALVDAAVSPHIEMFLLLALHTGARAGAILELTWDRVDFREQLVIYPPRSSQSKKRTAIVPMHAALGDALLLAREAAVTDWVIEYKGAPVKKITKGFAATVRRAQLEDVRVHDLRRTCASWMLMAGTPFEQVASYLADSVDVIQRHYGHFSPDWLRPAANAIEF